MRATKTAILSAILLTSCGGGGGSGGGQSDRQACAGYCDYACAKTVACLGASLSDADVCSNACITRINRDGSADADSCGAAAEHVAGLTCHELEVTLGLARSGAKDFSFDGSSLADFDRMFSGE